MRPWLARKLSPCTGLSAARIAGFATISTAPATAITMNQRIMIGAKKVATRAVPRDCTANSATRITTVSGSTYGPNAAVATSRPSTAESTDSAGVISVEP